MIRQDSINRVLSEYQQRRAIDVEARALSLLEGIHDDLDPDMKGWSLVAGQTGRFDEPKTISPGDLDALRIESQKSFYRDPYGRNIINTYVKFIIGRGIIIDFKEKDEDALLLIMGWWNKFAGLNRWFSLQREVVIRSLRDGEAFIRRFPMPGDTPLVLRFIDPEKVNSSDLKASYGIETDPTDVENIIAYYVQHGMSLDRDKIPAEDVVHIKMGVDRNVRRGRPLLESMLPFITLYKKWLDTRMVLNIVRTSVALVRHVKGSPTNLANLRSATASQSTRKETDRTKMLRSGTIITATPGVEYDMLSPNLDARDAAQDGRTILLALAAAAGLPDVFVTADFANSNFASTVVSQNPAIRLFEEHQQLYSEVFSQIIKWALDDGVEKGEIPAAANLDHDISYPPLLKRDLLNEVNAWEKMIDLQLSSRRTASLNLGIDPDQEKKMMAEETPLPIIKPKRPDTVPKRVEDRKPRDNVQV